MRYLTRRLTLTASAVAVTMAIAACAPSAPTSQSSTSGPAGSATSSGGTASATGGTVNIATTTDVVNYNPLVGNSRTDYWITNLMYPHLLTIAADGTKQASLATKWGYTNPTTGYYDIRGDMTWSDGVKLTAKDVAYTINAVIKDKPAGTLYGQLTNVKSATATSDTHVEITLIKPDSTVVNEVGFWGNIVPEHVFSKAGNVAKFANDNNWVSAGPFVLTNVVKGQSYTMDAVKSYPMAAGGAAKVSKIVYRVYPDVNTEILALQKGDVDMIANAIPPAQVKNLQNSDGIKLAEIPGLGYAHMTYNMSKAPLDKLAVRKALAYSVDYNAIRNVVLQGQGVSTGSSPIMPVLKTYYDASLKEYPYDPAQARQFLTDAGYKADSNGKFPLSFRLIYSLQDAVTSQWVNLVKDGAAKAGITITLQGLERNTYLAKTAVGDFDVYAGNFAIMDDPTTNMALTYLKDGSINYSYVDDPALSSLIEKSRVATDQQTAIGLLQQAAKLVHDNVYDNVMYTQNLYVAYRSNINGLVVKPSELLSVVDPASLAQITKS
ncbi:peptide/nickel transport system substrate-binding protein [Nakamurella panacisegetis]|uniref:Peptide/nickel transport system substrate-binding protein n=1 Tax=Nakamurella panacisegetis TaxID=1090615 RepID=A0A1H0RBF5_9ACTN|nr:ABC transporter substrate-binding protein [Nakamurella panacisegetis]SDP26366.1 peptide/nickel transport system substrate-binding protein [Nakamurella panacisegetis]